MTPREGTSPAPSLGALLATIETLVTHESPSRDTDAVRESAELVARLGERMVGLPGEIIATGPSTNVRWILGEGPRRVLLLGHHDTVWPVGSLERIPFSVVGDTLRGPGCFDMKAGIAMMLHAVAALDSADGVSMLLTGDEETGSHQSRALIEAEARRHHAVLVLEAAADGGALKSARKGVSQYSLIVHGRASHAGLAPDDGVNATVELAHQVLAIAQLSNSDHGTTVTPTVIAGGTTGNTVPALARVQIDVRAWTALEQWRVDTALRSQSAVLEGAAVSLDGGVNRLPMEAGSSEQLLARASRVARRLSLPPVKAVAVGGGSDGNITASAGTATLDGLGAVGGGAHADDEYVVVSELVPRTMLLSALIADILDAGTGDDDD